MKPVHGSQLAQVLDVAIAPIDMDAALDQLHRALEQRTKGFVCLAGAHGIMEAHRNPQIRAAFDASLLTAPDGTPTVWVGRWQGHTAMRQITGPDLMLQVLGHPRFAGRTHFLYGGKPGIALELQHELERRIPGVRILGTYTPPFRPLLLTEEEDLIATIAQLKPDIIWVGISTPRQELFMHRMISRLETTLMFGVGAAFDFHTGRIKDCPLWVKRAGLQWLDRLIQNPRHLWKRYLRNNPAFILHVLLQLGGLQRAPAPQPAILSPRLQNTGSKL